MCSQKIKVTEYLNAELSFARQMISLKFQKIILTKVKKIGLDPSLQITPASKKHSLQGKLYGIFSNIQAMSI